MVTDMFKLCSEGQSLFGIQKSYTESASVVSVNYLLKDKHLPDVNTICDFLKNFPKRDEIELTIGSYKIFMYKSSDGELDRNEYISIFDDCMDEDEIDINLYITKNFDEANSISVYDFDKIVAHYHEVSHASFINTLSSLFKQHSFLRFEVLDKPVMLYTKYIGFFNQGESWSNVPSGRDAESKVIVKNSMFLQHIDIPLIPNDFRIEHNTLDTSDIANRFEKLETVFSSVYLANDAYIEQDKLIFHLSPTGNKMFSMLDEIPYNASLCDLFQWSFLDTFSSERTGITRNVLSDNCKTTNDFFAFDEELMSSVKSNYMLYQHKTVDQYISLKKQIAATIVDTSKQLQEIVHGLVEAMRNNFIAVIMFLITVVLTDSVKWEDLKNGAVLNNDDLVKVIRLFIIASGAYLVVTIISAIVKWHFFKKSYMQLKESYEDLLDSNDLRNTFNNDKIINDTRKTIIVAGVLISLVWSAFILAVFVYIS